ncbi:ABC transporter permease [Dermatophilus congolensis]|uniref:ABC-2 type transporter n=1 Tax=Dermatophilus congolensis TaxID=1863 RepID=A0A239VUU7_9MICO|nr:ABC transporter permease [Dermatophilus congolensis]SNV25566.1 ABC-2 type transporter [Dermatophilus congolensis]
MSSDSVEQEAGRAVTRAVDGSIIRADAVPYHKYEPHRAGLPNLKVYFKDLWERKEFAVANSRAGMRAANTMTFFGQAWLVINPLLLALVYFMLVTVLQRKGYQPSLLAHITGGIFVFYYFQGAVLQGASSVTGAGKMVVNTSFPRLLLPMTSVRTALFRFLPTIPVYFIFHITAGNPFTWATFIVAPIFLALLTLFTFGLAALFSTAQVYFRDTSSFLPYIMRIWLYVSPVLWTVDLIDRYPVMKALIPFNPLYSLIGGYNQVLQEGVVPSLDLWLMAIGWSVVSVAAGSFFFLSREREFAVRL